MRLVGYSFAGVEPEVMGVGPVPATERALKLAGLTIDDIEAFEVNEAFAVQVLAFLEHYGIADDDPRVNPYGGAIAYMAAMYNFVKYAKARFMMPRRD